MAEREHGEIPPGLVVRHACDNPPCCNPAHLIIGTYQENARDAVDRGRQFSPFRGVTECIRGHAFTEENTNVGASGSRQCKTCKTNRQRNRRAA